MPTNGHRSPAESVLAADLVPSAGKAYTSVLRPFHRYAIFSSPSISHSREGTTRQTGRAATKATAVLLTVTHVDSLSSSRDHSIWTGPFTFRERSSACALRYYLRSLSTLIRGSIRGHSLASMPDRGSEVLLLWCFHVLWR